MQTFLSKKKNQMRILNNQISLYTYQFHNDRPYSIQDIKCKPVSPSTELTGILNFHLNNDICTILFSYYFLLLPNHCTSDLYIILYLNPTSLNVLRLSGSGGRKFCLSFVKYRFVINTQHLITSGMQQCPPKQNKKNI